MTTLDLTVGELLRIGLGARFRTLAGAAGFSRPVTWVSIVSTRHSHDPVPGELILLAPPYQDAFGRLKGYEKGEASGAALLLADAPLEAIAWADARQWPLVSLSSDTDLLLLQRNLLRLVLDREVGLAARKAEVLATLTRLSAENQGLDGIAASLASMSHHGVVIQDKRLEVIASAPPPSAGAVWEQLLENLIGPTSLPDALQDRKHAGRLVDPFEQPLRPGGSRLVLPVSVRAVARGYLSLVSLGEPFGPWDFSLIEQGSAACAVEMAKAKAVHEARKELTGGLIEAILTGTVGESEAERWAERSNYRRAGPHVALVLKWISAGAPSLRRLEAIVSTEVRQLPHRALAQLRGDELVMYLAADAETGRGGVREWVAGLYERANSEFPGSHLAVGIGRPVSTLLGLRQSYAEASQAMQLERQLQQHRPQHYSDLGIYRLLLPLRRNPDLGAFVRETLGRLIEYDIARGTDELETLRAFFQHNGNLVQTARALHVHRNTLLYRLQRACEIGRLDLDDPETRLALQIALRAQELLRMDGDLPPPV